MTSKPSQTHPNVGPGPVEAEPNHVREKTYVAPNPPAALERERDALPEATAEEKVERDLPEAVAGIKRKL